MRECIVPGLSERKARYGLDSVLGAESGTRGASERHPAMRVFLDFEASSLAEHSYPIEVGWAGEDGWREAHLIRPAPAWTDWDLAAEAVHGIPRERLLTEGEPHEAVARRALEALSPHEVFVSAPSWDGKWMSVLLRAASLPRHALRFKETDAACRAAVAEILGVETTQAELQRLADHLLAQARSSFAAEPPRHRALADAEAELAVWREVRRLAEEEAAVGRGEG